MRITGKAGKLRRISGKKDIKTAEKLRKRIKEPGINCNRVSTGNRENFLAVFGEDTHSAGLRHRIRRTFRRTCCFSKTLENHREAFEMAFFYINYGFV
jgi:IS1 family transposase